MPAINGLLFDDAGVLQLSATNVVAAIAPGGVAVDANGAACYFDGAPDVIHQGVGLMRDGRLAIIVITPPALRAFSNGFSNGFS